MSTETRSLELDCGGRVLLEVDADWLHMSDTDLMFVRGLASAMDDHRAGAAEALCTPAEPPPAPAPSPILDPEPSIMLGESDDPLERYYTSPPGVDRRSRPWRCDCGAVGRGGGGLSAHLRAHQRTPPADLVAVALAPTAAAASDFHGVHRIAREDNGTGAKRIYCSCGWVTPPHSDRVVARQDFADHLDGVACQSESA